MRQTLDVSKVPLPLDQSLLVAPIAALFFVLFEKEFRMFGIKEALAVIR